MEKQYTETYDEWRVFDSYNLSKRDEDILTMHLRLWTDRGQDYCGQKHAWTKNLVNLGFIKKHKGYSRLTKKGLEVASRLAINEIEICLALWKE